MRIGEYDTKDGLAPSEFFADMNLCDWREGKEYCCLWNHEIIYSYIITNYKGVRAIDMILM